ncbi:MAG: nucleotide exchange factor GrpE [Candidatus Omnitrophica bacterium]|jgi:molecular chaperone GrpE|nr:nucleotide exchange factor GrpE [Candidatus Omnitrophota bacterium]
MEEKNKKKSNNHNEEVKSKEEGDPLTEEVQDNTKTAKEDREILEEKYLRLQAEFDNYKKRSYKEKIEFIKFANEGLILELLDILDNFERGIKSAEAKKDFALLHQGVDMISKQLHSMLEAKGLKRISCVGEKFDPHKHDAIEVVEGEEKETDTVIEELQPGYILNGRIIRPAKVKVLKGKENLDIIEEIPEEINNKDNDNRETKDNEKV